MESDISATDAARSFSDLLNRVRYRGETFVIRRGGEAVCRMVPAEPQRCTVSDLMTILRKLSPGEDYFVALGEASRKQPKVPRKTAWER